MEELKKKIREIPNFPKEGILFYDVTTLLKDREGFRQVIDTFADRYSGQNIDKVLGIESRGFILGPPLAYQLNAGFVPIRKKGKLPAETVSISYDLEYGSDSLEVHRDAVAPGERVIIIDDLIATGGTAAAAAEMVRGIEGQIVEMAFMVELEFLSGRDKLNGLSIFSLLKY